MQVEFEPFFYPKIGDSSVWVKVPKEAKRHPWFVLEKVHGSCFLMATNGVDVRCAKRTAWLEENDGYHDVTKLVDEYSERLKKLHAVLNANPAGGVTYVFGELYGSEIQDEIFYGVPHMSFIVFDVACNKVFVDYSKVLEACADAGMPCLQPLFKGSMEKCLAYKVDFVSTIPKMHNSQAESKAEGVVVKCSVEISIGLEKGGPVRGVCKIKSQKFSEVLSDAAVVRGKELSAIKAHVTRNRLINVLSKRGKAQQQQHDVLCEALLSDVLEEAATKSLLRMYIDGNRKSVEEALAPLCADCVLSWATEQKKKNKK